jgi:hypothetical protein
MFFAVNYAFWLNVVGTSFTVTHLIVADDLVANLSSALVYIVTAILTIYWHSRQAVPAMFPIVATLTALFVTVMRTDSYWLRLGSDIIWLYLFQWMVFGQVFPWQWFRYVSKGNTD